ncbi:SET domain-containing protein SmydA-8, isoform B [Chionoecetes opilio]|uniref:SET domain-containing protein SmydA-8, isoform B n=1 Tax=Chionoecetes opilio TaxID=41210 RepID=A0A8J4Y9E4_CHIOP|nr:SET domain-containing protein SmydA-8, isoform B [Chionoecetes opilio]
MGGGRGTGGGPCGVCQAASRLTCGGCGDIHYCGRDHQRRHWAHHRLHCRPYKELTHPKLGRYLVASRRLKAGQEVMEDLPLAFGPLPVSPLVCLGCHGPVPEKLPRCPGCWWPLCSPECAASSLHRQECPVLAKDTEHVAVPDTHEETSRYDLILVVRMLLLRDARPKAWAALMDMEHHMDRRAHEGKLELQTSVNLIRDVLGLDFTAEEVEQVRGAIATNGMQMMSPAAVPLRVLHPRVRLFNHSCIPNLQLSFTDDGLMIVRTAVPLEAGDPMYVTYTGTTIPLWERLSCLKENYFFACECRRCSDPTEMGTDFSNPRCPECRDHLMQPTTWLGATTWACPSCKVEKCMQRVKEEVHASLSSLDMMDVVDSRSYKRLQYLLEQVEQDYHPQHYVWMKVAQTMLHKLQDYNTDTALKMRVNIWNKLSVLYGKLEPGLTRRRGMSFLELGLSIMKAVRNEYQNNTAYIPSLLQQLKPVVGYFQEAEDILSFEPATVRLHVLAERARVGKEK